MILAGDSFRGGMRTMGMHKFVKKITSARSGGMFRFGILFQGGKRGKIKGQRAKERRAKG
jgi:hypothetical protein